MNRETYRIVFSDIDGTLLNSSNQVPDSAKREIRRLYRGGVPFVLVSARMASAMTHIRQELGTGGPMVCYGGALVLDEEGRTIYSCSMPLSLALPVKREMENRFPGLCCSVYGGDIWAVDCRQDERVAHDEHITGTKAVEQAADSGIFENTGVHKLLYMGDPKEIHAASLWLKEHMPQINAACSSPNYLEVMKAGVGKAQGMEAVCRHLGIDCRQAVAFGDGYNDLDMLCAAGRGYAMANAPEGVRAAAPYVTKANDEDGIAFALRECFPEAARI